MNEDAAQHDDFQQDGRCRHPRRESPRCRMLTRCDARARVGKIPLGPQPKSDNSGIHRVNRAGGVETNPNG